MLELIKNKAVRIRQHLSMLDDQPIGRAALTILIFLDLFVLISIFDGLSEHTGQLTSPEQLIPQYCRDIVIEGEWNDTERLTRLTRIVSASTGSYYLPDERERTRERHRLCAPIAKHFLAIEDDKGLTASMKEYLRIRQETEQLDSELERMKSAYDTQLLEKIADQGERQANIDSIRKELADKTAAIEALVQQGKLLDSSLKQDERIHDLFVIIDNITQADRNTLRDDLRQLNFWYPVKRLGMEMVFLLPLVLIFYLWNTRSITTNRPFQALVSSHLLVVVFIPVLIKIIELLYDIIPRKLLKHIIELLESLKLVALWHYLLMGVIILAAMALIYFFQKKLFSREKLMEKRISNGSCQRCGKHLPLETHACPFCGFEQFKPCPHCSKLTYVYGKFCKECGHGE
jgi:predicted RNA-binding Zn-ribbon protein involved in translation (DUF1610 family)